MKPSWKRTTAYVLALVLGVTGAIGSIPPTIARADETTTTTDATATTEPTTSNTDEQNEQTETATTTADTDGENDSQEPVVEEESAEPATTAAESSSSTSSDTSYKYTLPTDLKWSTSRDGWATFKVNDTQRGLWALEVDAGDATHTVYLDSFGEEYTDLGSESEVEYDEDFRNGNIVTMCLTDAFSTSGDYKFRIAIEENDGVSETDNFYSNIKWNHWTNWSDPYTYNSSKSKLPTPTNPAWSTSKQNTATWTNVAGVKRYEVQLCVDNDPDWMYSPEFGLKKQCQ